MQKHVIPRSQTLAEIIAALAQLQRDYECEPDDYAPTAERLCTERLARVLRVDETIGLVKVVKAKRVRCSVCKSCIPTTQAAGDLCISCASKRQRQNEANQQTE